MARTGFHPRAMGLVRCTGDTCLAEPDILCDHDCTVGVQANRYMVWKSSSLSAMLALSEELHMRIGSLRSLSENESTLEYTRASLKQNSDGEWRLQGSPNG
jgi:hypothetical protein